MRDLVRAFGRVASWFVGHVDKKSSFNLRQFTLLQALRDRGVATAIEIHPDTMYARSDVAGLSLDRLVKRGLVYVDPRYKSQQGGKLYRMSPFGLAMLEVHEKRIAEHVSCAAMNVDDFGDLRGAFELFASSLVSDDVPVDEASAESEPAMGESTVVGGRFLEKMTVMGYTVMDLERRYIYAGMTNAKMASVNKTKKLAVRFVMQPFWAQQMIDNMEGRVYSVGLLREYGAESLSECLEIVPTRLTFEFESPDERDRKRQLYEG